MAETVTEQRSESFHWDLLQYAMSTLETHGFDLSSLTSSQHFEEFIDCILDELRSPFGCCHADTQGFSVHFSVWDTDLIRSFSSG